jgi:hypothetical protein
MVPGLSHLPHASMGGIAQHFVAKGEVVVPVPLVHIMDEDVLSIYNENGEKIGNQLILNYCYGIECFFYSLFRNQSSLAAEKNYVVLSRSMFGKFNDWQ